MGFLQGSDGKEWVWIMGEHKDDKSLEQILEEEAQENARLLAEREAEALRSDASFHCYWNSIGSSGWVEGGGTRNMKSMGSPLAAIFLWLISTGRGGWGHGPLGTPLGSATVEIHCSQLSRNNCLNCTSVIGFAMISREWWRHFCLIFAERSKKRKCNES